MALKVFFFSGELFTHPFMNLVSYVMKLFPAAPVGSINDYFSEYESLVNMMFLMSLLLFLHYHSVQRNWLTSLTKLSLSFSTFTLEDNRRLA